MVLYWLFVALFGGFSVIAGLLYDDEDVDDLKLYFLPLIFAGIVGVSSLYITAGFPYLPKLLEEYEDCKVADFKGEPWYVE